MALYRHQMRCIARRLEKAINKSNMFEKRRVTTTPNPTPLPQTQHFSWFSLVQCLIECHAAMSSPFAPLVEESSMKFQFHLEYFYKHCSLSERNLKSHSSIQAFAHYRGSCLFFFFLLLSATQEKCHDSVEIWLNSHVNLVQICINAFFCPEGSEHDTASRGRSGLTVGANLIFTLIMIINIFLSLLVIFVCFWILKLATETIRRGFSWKHLISY